MLELAAARFGRTTDIRFVVDLLRVDPTGLGGGALLVVVERDLRSTAAPVLGGLVDVDRVERVPVVICGAPDVDDEDSGALLRVTGGIVYSGRGSG